MIISSSHPTAKISSSPSSRSPPPPKTPSPFLDLFFPKYSHSLGFIPARSPKRSNLCCWIGVFSGDGWRFELRRGVGDGQDQGEAPPRRRQRRVFLILLRLRFRYLLQGEVEDQPPLRPPEALALRFRRRQAYVALSFFLFFLCVWLGGFSVGFWRFFFCWFGDWVGGVFGGGVGMWLY